jgi:hypothetical protein
MSRNSTSRKFQRFMTRLGLAKSMMTGPWGQSVSHHVNLKAELASRGSRVSSAVPETSNEHMLLLTLIGSAKAEVVRVNELYLTLSHRVAELELALADKTAPGK